jgi:uncharacterized membrane protein
MLVGELRVPWRHGILEGPSTLLRWQKLFVLAEAQFRLQVSTPRGYGDTIGPIPKRQMLTISNTGLGTTTVAADNVVVALYFAFLFSISKAGEPTTTTTQDQNEASSNDSNPEETIAELAVEQQQGSSSITLATLGTSISVASTLVSAGILLTRSFLPSGTSSLPMISVLTVAAATIFPKFFSRISETGTALGVSFIQMFFAASGAAGSIRLVLQQAPALFAFSFIQIGVHFATLMALGKGLFRLPNRELYLASNANVGG